MRVHCASVGGVLARVHGCFRTFGRLDVFLSFINISSVDVVGGGGGLSL